MDVEKVWQAEWGGKILFSHREGEAIRGVAIMLKRGCKVNINLVLHDDRGRCILADNAQETESYILGNIYTPTQNFPAEQLSLMNFL